MELIYLKYTPKNKYVLLLKIGSRNNKLCGFMSEKVPDLEREKILLHKKKLNDMSIDRQLAWMKEQCPVSYKDAYREILNTNAQIISLHTLKD